MLNRPPRQAVALRGLIFVVSGPSGSGKTTLVNKLLRKRKVKGLLTKSVSYTTRRPRCGETSGRDYFFISEEEFFLNRSKGKFLEWTRYLDGYYATSKKFVEQALQQNKNIIFSIDIKGAFNIKKLFPNNTVLIFILPPSLEILAKRLKSRRSEEATDFNKRLKIAREEIRQAEKYDYTVVNTDLKTTVAELASIVDRECQGKRREK